MSYQCCCSFVVSVFSGSISIQLFNQFDSVWKPIKSTCSSFTSLDVFRKISFYWYIWYRYKYFSASVTELTLENCTGLIWFSELTVLNSVIYFWFLSCLFFLNLGRMSRVATVRFAVLCKYIVGQMGYCSHLCIILQLFLCLYSERSSTLCAKRQSCCCPSDIRASVLEKRGPATR